MALIRRGAKLYTKDGKTLPISGWAHLYGVDEKAIRTRLQKGWSIDRAIHEPLRTQYGHPGARKKALLFNKKIYEGCVHKKCGTRLKYTLSGSCLNCSAKD